MSMTRPSLINFLAVKTAEFISLKASIALLNNPNRPTQQSEKNTPSLPLDSIRMLRSHEFRIELIGKGLNQEVVYKKIFDSDSFGHFKFKISRNEETAKIHSFEVFETSKHPGVKIYLGSYLPVILEKPLKIIICDFDKTLVDTRYSSTKDVYTSLTSPLSSFPTLPASLDLLKEYTDQDYIPFILSASPHFYEASIRDWLYQNGIYNASIFLKDYRQVFNFLVRDLTPKDLKNQGLYKLNHLLDIILMVGTPDDIVLIGDNFESDPLIYMVLAEILAKKREPSYIWNKIKSLKPFMLNNKQNSNFLSKIYQLQSNMSGVRPHFKVYIRKILDEKTVNLPEGFESLRPMIKLYDGTQKSRPGA